MQYENEKPAPLTDFSVAEYPGFPVNVENVVNSTLEPDGFRAALFIWATAWGQLPAASLPNDDRLLMAASRADAATWERVRKVALRGFIECSDGRLYHPHLAEKARQARQELDEGIWQSD